MKLNLVGRFALALFAASTLGLGMTGCGGGSIAYMWAIGQQYNQIAGFKVDDFTGNLTQIPHQPFSTAGTNPVSIVVKPGGRYVYVLNQGTPCTKNTTTCLDPTQVHYTGGNVSVFSVGGDGTLTLQQTYQTQGYDSQWLQMDSTGGYLYVLDKYSPSGDGNGAITAFQADASSGRLYLVQNQATQTGGGTPKTYFEVGSGSLSLPNPFMTKTAGNCLYVATPTTITSFSFSNGQLIVPSSGTFITGNNITSINGNSTFLAATDSAANTVTLYSTGSNCSLTAAGGGAYSLAQYNTNNPVYTLIDNSNKFLYVVNNSNPNTTQPSSSILIFDIIGTNSQLQFVTGGNTGTSSGANCMVEDPTGQYMYVSGHNDGTISGYKFDSARGYLPQLDRGSTFNATGQLTCLAISGNVNSLPARVSWKPAALTPHPASTASTLPARMAGTLNSGDRRALPRRRPEPKDAHEVQQAGPHDEGNRPGHDRFRGPGARPHRLQPRLRGRIRLCDLLQRHQHHRRHHLGLRRGLPERHPHPDRGLALHRPAPGPHRLHRLPERQVPLHHRRLPGR